MNVFRCEKNIFKSGIPILQIVNKTVTCFLSLDNNSYFLFGLESIKYFPPDNRFSTDVILVASRYFMDIHMSPLQTSTLGVPLRMPIEPHVPTNRSQTMIVLDWNLALQSYESDWILTLSTNDSETWKMKSCTFSFLCSMDLGKGWNWQQKKNIHKVYFHCTPANRTVKKWFGIFHQGHFKLSNTLWVAFRGRWRSLLASVENKQCRQKNLLKFENRYLHRLSPFEEIWFHSQTRPGGSTFSDETKQARLSFSGDLLLRHENE